MLDRRELIMKENFIFFRFIVKTVLFFAAATCLLAGCANIASSDGKSSSKGAIALTLPESPRNAGVSLDITADGTTLPTPGATDAEAQESDTINRVLCYTVKVRDNQNGTVQEKENLDPGQTIIIDGLLPGDYTVAIFAYGNKLVDVEIVKDQILYYGRSEKVTVEPEKENVASVKLSSIINRTQTVAITLLSGAEGVEISSSSGYDSYVLNYTGDNPVIKIAVYCKETGKLEFKNEITNAYINSTLISGIPGLTINPFLEPGFTYTCTANIYNSEGALIFTGTKELPAVYDDINFEVDATFRQKQFKCNVALNPNPNRDEKYYTLYAGNSGVYWILKDGKVQIEKTYLAPVLCTVSPSCPTVSEEKEIPADSFTVESALSSEKAAKTVGFKNGGGLEPLPFIVKATVDGEEYEVGLEFPVLYESVSPTVEAVATSIKKDTVYSVNDLVNASLPVYCDWNGNEMKDETSVLFKYSDQNADYTAGNNGGTITFTRTGSVTVTVYARVTLTPNSDDNEILSCSTIKPKAYDAADFNASTTSFWESVASKEAEMLEPLEVTKELTFIVGE